MKKLKFKNVAISLSLATALYVGLIVVEGKILMPNGTVNGYLAKTDIEEGTIINENNFDNLFKAKNNIDGELEVSNMAKSKEELFNKRVNENINKGEVLSLNDLLDKDDILANIEEPVETSLKVNDISQVVGGLLREGDLIDISVIDEITGDSMIVLEDVYVNKALTLDGTVIPRNSELSATTINLLMSKADEMKLNNKIEGGIIRLRKVK